MLPIILILLIFVAAVLATALFFWEPSLLLQPRQGLPARIIAFWQAELRWEGREAVALGLGLEHIPGNVEAMIQARIADAVRAVEQERDAAKAELTKANDVLQRYLDADLIARRALA